MLHTLGGTGESAKAVDCRQALCDFALMAATTIALSVVAVTAARHHVALTDKFESAKGVCSAISLMSLTTS
jgi:hypothetical protein